MNNPRHVVLLGASVGKAWNIQQLSERLDNYEYVFEYVGVYQFDKSKGLHEQLKRMDNKPDAIFIKECAAYFPSDITLENARLLMERWIKQCQEKGIVPIPATIVPVTHTHDDRFKTHNPIKRIIKRILRKSMKTRMQRIREYNDFIKTLPNTKGLTILDLETPLRISDKDRYLQDDLTKGDGLHLNAKAYQLLDEIVIPTLEKVNFPLQHNK